MNKTINIKFIVAVILAVAISIFVFLNLKTLELTHDIFDSVKNLVDSKSESKAKTKTKVHGNSNKNMKPHIVYEIYGIDDWEAKTTIKYGISSQKDYKRKQGNPRPNLQLKLISQNHFCEHFNKIEYIILDEKIPNRKAAKILEQKYVTEYYLKYKRKPLLQELPLPENYIFDF